MLLALIISGVTLLATVASEVAGTRGVVLAALLAGFADTHAAAIGVAALVAAGRMDAHEAVVPILAALTTNTVSKMVAAQVTGGWSFARPVGLGLLALIAAAWVGWGVQAAL